MNVCEAEGSPHLIIFLSRSFQYVTILASLTQESIVSNQAKFRVPNGLSLKLLNSLHDFLMHGHSKKARAIKGRQLCSRCKPQARWRRYIWPYCYKVCVYDSRIYSRRAGGPACLRPYFHHLRHVPFQSIRQSRVTGHFQTLKSHGGHGDFGQLPKPLKKS